MMSEPPSGFAAAVAIATVAVALGYAPAARAENTTKRARVLFDAGRKLAKQGLYDEACPKLLQSFQLEPGVGTQFNLADCLEHVGETERARTLFLDVADKSREHGQTERAAVAHERAAALAHATTTPPQTPIAEPKPEPQVEKLPEVVIHEPTDQDRAPKPAESSDTTATPLPVQLRDEYSALADAASKLEKLRQAAASLPHSRVNDAQVRAITQRLRALQGELDDSWQIAGSVAAAALRNASWAARHAKQTAATRASAPPPVAAPRSATGSRQLVSTTSDSH
jgi:tetratricopeptide (TPR) repeat protein